jgi:DNA-binding NarL/FixJ family response regulator
MSKCILIVDDSYVIRSATRHFLETQTEFAVCGEATDGIDAIEKTRHLTPDLIILDLAMPRMNGLEAARKLRAMSVKAPIILFTMYADVLPQEETTEAGISAVVSKTDLPALQHLIEELLVAY